MADLVNSTFHYKGSSHQCKGAASTVQSYICTGQQYIKIILQCCLDNLNLQSGFDELAPEECRKKVGVHRYSHQLGVH